MKNNIFKISIIFLLIFSFVVLLKSLNNSNFYIPKIKNEKSLINFSSYELYSDKKLLSEEIFTGSKFYVLNIWASWCAPCRKEHAYLMNLSKQKNIEIIGLNYKDKYENAKNFLSKSNNPYSFIFLDKDGTIAIEWGAYGVPESFLIYKNKIIKKIIGPLDENLLLEIKKIIQ